MGREMYMVSSGDAPNPIGVPTHADKNLLCVPMAGFGNPEMEKKRRLTLLTIVITNILHLNKG